MVDKDYLLNDYKRYLELRPNVNRDTNPICQMIDHLIGDLDLPMSDERKNTVVQKICTAVDCLKVTTRGW